VECIFEVWDLVCLFLQPQWKSSLKNKGAEKLEPKFYEPYKIVRCIGEVAYELELPEGCKIYNVFHVSCLKKALGKHIVTFIALDEEGELILFQRKFWRKVLPLWIMCYP